MPESSNPVLATILKGMLEQQDKNHRENGERNDITNARLTAIEASVASFKKAFPDEDIDGHCDYHQTLIDRATFINEILREVLKHLAKYGLLGMLGWACWILFSAVIKSLPGLIK